MPETSSDRDGQQIGVWMNHWVAVAPSSASSACEEESKELVSVVTASLETERAEVSRLKKALEGSSLPSSSVDEQKKYEAEEEKQDQEGRWNQTTAKSFLNSNCVFYNK